MINTQPTTTKSIILEAMHLLVDQLEKDELREGITIEEWVDVFINEKGLVNE